MFLLNRWNKQDSFHEICSYNITKTILQIANSINLSLRHLSQCILLCYLSFILIVFGSVSSQYGEMKLQ